MRDEPQENTSPSLTEAVEAARRIINWDKRAAHVGDPALLTVSGLLVKDALLVANTLPSLVAQNERYSEALRSIMLDAEDDDGVWARDMARVALSEEQPDD